MVFKRFTAFLAVGLTAGFLYVRADGDSRWLRLVSSRWAERVRPVLTKPLALQAVTTPGLPTVAAPLTTDTAAPEPKSIRVPALVSAARIPIRVGMAGLIADVSTTEGDAVVVDQLLVRMDDREIGWERQRQAARIAALGHELTEATTHLGAARDEWDRNQALRIKGAVSEQAVVASRLAVEARTARLAAIDSQLIAERSQLGLLDHRLQNYCRIVSPIAGTVVEVLRQPGTFVQPGDILLYVEAGVQHLKAHLAPGLLPELENLQFALFRNGAWSVLELAQAKAGINPDGSRTLVFRLPPRATFMTGEIVTLQASRKESLP